MTPGLRFSLSHQNVTDRPSFLCLVLIIDKSEIFIKKSQCFCLDDQKNNNTNCIKKPMIEHNKYNVKTPEKFNTPTPIYSNQPDFQV